MSNWARIESTALYAGYMRSLSLVGGIVVTIFLTFSPLVCAQTGPDLIPSATRAINAASSEELSNAISNAEAGDHIILADGSYSGFTITKSGQSGKPIVIRAANVLGATITGDIMIDGNHIWIVGVEMGSHRIIINGSDDRVARNRFSNVPDYTIIASKSSRKAEIDHNEINNGDGGENGDRIGIRMNYSSGAGDNVYNHHIHHNYLHNTVGKNNNAIESSGNGQRRDTLTGVVIEYNLIENWPGGRQVSLKSSGNIVRFNTSINGGKEEYVNRVGHSNQWIANWSDESRLRIYDRNNTVIGNVVPRLEVRSGSDTAASADVNHKDPPKYIAATRTLVSENSGTLRVGLNFRGYDSAPALDTRIEVDDESPIEYGNHAGTTVSATTNHPTPTTFKLTPSQVGPYAPTAPKID
jgi:poly(beta-D-mannuronate) lyase